MKFHTTFPFWSCLMAGVAMLSYIPTAAGTDLTNLRCEYRENPRGIDVEKPRLSCVLKGRGREIDDRGQKQTAYQVLVASSEELLKKNNGDLWDSGKLASGQSIDVEYAGTPLESRRVCHWKIRVSDMDGKPSAWRAPAGWSMGLLHAGDWQAKWVKAGGETSPWLRKEFALAAVPEGPRPS